MGVDNVDYTALIWQCRSSLTHDRVVPASAEVSRQLHLIVCKRLLGPTFRARAILTMLSKLMFRSPRSTLPIYVRWTPASSA